jgi:putative DNA primase/helicase
MTDTEQDLLAAIESGTIASKLSTPLSTEEIDALVEMSKTDPGAPFESQAVARIRATKRADLATFIRVRSRLKEANILVGELDKALQQGEAAGDEDDEALAGRPLDLVPPEPWPEPVHGATLLDEMAFEIRRYVMLPRQAATAIALWIVHCYGFDLFPITPRLLIESPTPRCGKTRLIEILQALVPRALRADNISAAAMFRTVELCRPVVLIDEADSFLKNSEDHRNIVNSGHARGGAVVRTVGENFEPRQFSTFTPVALASIGSLAATIMDRSIVVIMRRRLPSEPVDRFKSDRAGHLHELARKAARWIADHKDVLRDADPEMPQELHDRAADNWQPLLAIADLAGWDWPQQARVAAQTLSAQASEQDDQSRGVMLLADVRSVFNERPSKAGKDADRISSTGLVEALVALIDRPWATWSKGKPITPAAVARQLKMFGIVPSTIKLSDGKQPNGYKRSQFDDAFGRYLPQPPDPAVQSSPSSPTPANSGASGQSQSSPAASDGELPELGQSLEKQGLAEDGELSEPAPGSSEDSDSLEDLLGALLDDTMRRARHSEKAPGA